MSQYDLFSEANQQPETLDALFNTMMQMTDDPLANAGTNVVISRGKSPG